jgi:tight adherence protein C
MIGMGPVIAIVIVMLLSLSVLALLLSREQTGKVQSRLQGLVDQGEHGSAARPSVVKVTQRALPKLGTMFMPNSEVGQARLKTRLIQAGLYRPNAMHIYLGIKVLIMAAPVAVGFLLGLAHVVPVSKGILFGTLASGIGWIGPGFWLDKRKAARQYSLKRALPDTLDLLVICLEGGLSMQGAMRRVVSELQTAHPLLATELSIVQREIQLGQTTGESLQRFAMRCDVEEVRSLAVTVLQSDRYGASLVKALKVNAETLRTKRLQSAEEKGQKAVVKILIPTLLFIFPSIFVVILGPAFIQVAAMFARMK